MKSACKMRFNKSELASLAAQPSHKFEKEGVLFVKERTEGFFRRTESEYNKISALSKCPSNLISQHGMPSSYTPVNKLLFVYLERD